MLQSVRVSPNELSHAGSMMSIPINGSGTPRLAATLLPGSLQHMVTAWSSSFVVTNDAGHSIDSLSNRDGKNATLACVERLTPLPISIRKIGNSAGLSLKRGDAPLNGRLGKGKMLNPSLPLAIGHTRNSNVNDCAKLAAALNAKNRESRVGLVCRRRECPDLTGMKFGCGWRGLPGATAKKETRANP